MKLNASNISIIKRLLGGRNNRPLRAILRKFEPQDLSRLYGHLNSHETRQFTEALMSLDMASDALQQLPEDHLAEAVRLSRNYDQRRQNWDQQTQQEEGGDH